MAIRYISEEEVRGLVDHATAFDAVREVFSAMARGDARNFPVVREVIGHADALFGFKSGFDRSRGILGLKAGGYWPGNETRGLTNHQSTVFLFDPDSGQPMAAVAGNWLTAMRTAAASAVSIDLLARKNARVLGIIGAGFQSRFQIEAAIRHRDFSEIIGWNHHPEMLPNLERIAAELGLPFRAVDPAELGAQADVIITITSSPAAQLLADMVRPGTHIACMGTDTKGKQELDPQILATGQVFTDDVAQSVSIGEAQHAVAQGLMAEAEIAPIGAVLNGDHPGRSSAEEVTIFDGTGVGLQDLAVAHLVLGMSQGQQSSQASKIL